MKSTLSFKLLLSKVLTKVLPDRTKRLVMLSSLYACMCDSTSFDSNTISKLNKVMELSNKDSALEFPMRLSSVIWHHDQGKSIIYPSPVIQDNEKAIIEKILNKVPRCLLYSDKEKVSQDIAKLLAECQNLTS